MPLGGQKRKRKKEKELQEINESSNIMLNKKIKEKDSIIENMQMQFNSDIESLKSEYNKKLEQEIRAKEDLISHYDNNSNNINALQKEKEEIANRLNECMNEEKRR